MEVERSLKNDEKNVTEEQMNVLKTELSAVLSELKQKNKNTNPVQSKEESKILETDKIKILLENLKLMLNSGNPESLKMIDKLKLIPGSEELIQQIEDYNFKLAAKTLLKHSFV